MAQISTSTYQPTLMEKLLGRNYKWYYFLVNVKHKAIIGRLNSFLILNSVRTIEFFITIYVWKLNPNATSQIITYLILGRIFKRVITAGYGSIFADKIFSGSLTTQLMYPQDNFWLNFCHVLGGNLTRNLIDSTLMLILACLIFAKDIIFSINILYLPFFAALSFFLYFCVSYMIGCLAFFYNNKGDCNNLINAIYVAVGILAGEIIPLNLFLTGNFSFLQFTPFAYFLHLPMQIYLNKYSPLETLFVFLGGLAWCIALYFLAKLVFKMGLKRNESVGL